jgi:hypothetical protein
MKELREEIINLPELSEYREIVESNYNNFGRRDYEVKLARNKLINAIISLIKEKVEKIKENNPYSKDTQSLSYDLYDDTIQTILEVLK